MPRKVASAEFVISAVQPRDFPADGRPEIALVGRSNVGKSSLLNALVRRSIARTSASPGKTRQVNVYRITPGGDSPFYLMDLPGYGHAGGGEKAQREFAALTALYFGTRTASARITPAVHSEGGRAGNRAQSDVVSPLRGIVLTVDSRHPGLASDIEAYRWLHSLGVPLLLAATKVDKLTQSDKARLRQACLGAFGEEPLPVSAISGAGLDVLWQRLREWTDAQA